MKWGRPIRWPGRGAKFVCSNGVLKNTRVATVEKRTGSKDPQVCDLSVEHEGTIAYDDNTLLVGVPPGVWTVVKAFHDRNKFLDYKVNNG